MMRSSPAGFTVRDEPRFICYRFGGAEFDESTGQLWVAGAAVVVEPLPLQLLAELLRRSDEVLTKEDLFELLWRGRPTVDNVLANAVSKLRRALGDEGGRRIVTVPRVGYRLTGPVDRHAVGAASAKPMALEPGQAIPGRDGYALERCLGHTEHGLVWLACHTKTRDAKVFKFAFDSAGLNALKAEFASYRALRRGLGGRADLVRVVDANFLVPPFYIESEQGGTDLQRWSADGKPLAGMSLTDRLWLFQQIARLVAAAHDIGVLHADLKPANVLLHDASGARAVTLIDFGTSDRARLADERATSWGGESHGRPHDLGLARSASVSMYQAPELASGGVPTQLSDLYALGVLLYQFLVADFSRPLPSGWQTEVTDPWLLEDLSAAVAADPRERLCSVAELVRRLSQLETRRAEQWQRDKEIEQCQAAITELISVRRRRPLIATLVAALSLGLAASLWVAAGFGSNQSANATQTLDLRKQK